MPVPEQDLPVVLPEDLVPDGTGNPLAKSDAFLNCTCPKCGAAAKRETDTMDTFVDSAWYFSRYAAPDAQTMVDARTDYWMPMDQYIGGIEHAILHLLYSRFWAKVMRDLGLVAFGEPAKNLLTQGMVLNETFYREDAAGKKTWYNPADVTVSFDDKGRPVGAVLKSDGQPVELGGIEKMSKSKNNGVDPQMLIDHYGADTARLFTMFAAPPEQQLEWSGAGVDGASRFLRRVWAFGFANREALAVRAPFDAAQLAEADKTLRREIHGVLKQADFDYQRLQYNTVVSAAMKMLNAIEGAKGATPAVLRETYGVLLRVLYPVVPHVTFELWKALGYADEFGPLLDAPWPKVDEAALEQAEIELVLQVNGKVRGALKVAKDASREAIEAAAVADGMFAKFAEGRPAKKIIVVPGRLVNVVV
ncbi:tRNA synthetases class I family protein [Burkholderia pseudomallei MSHR4308]|nr:tRNA synthetases class I family protein [Burkholderia pseudomallei MSHR4308]